jgi:hypothetical protein
LFSALLNKGTKSRRPILVVEHRSLKAPVAIGAKSLLLG